MSTKPWRHISTTVAVVALALPAIALADPVVFQAAGGSPADIQSAVDDFRSFLGDNNAAGPPASDGRREINWDGVPDEFSAPNNLPANFFNANAPRGLVFFTLGSGFQVSANEGVSPIEFANLRPNLADKFTVFSPQKLFTALGSTIVEVLFFVPGAAEAATSQGFGAVFTDVDGSRSAKIEYFDVNGALLFSGFVPRATGEETLSFLGVGFDGDERVFLVRITSGTIPVGSARGGDVVAMDDFIFGEPQALP